MICSASSCPAPLSQGEDVCCLCARQGNCCCQTNPATAYLSFPLSAAEWQRLLPYQALATTAGMAEKELFSQEESALPLLEILEQQQNLDTQENTPPAQGDAICAIEQNLPDFVLAIKTVLPRDKTRIDVVFPAGGTHARLKTRKDGSCVFLGSTGCRLPRAVRPWYCRLFPAWVDGASLTLLMAQECLVVQQSQGPAQGIALLKTTPAEVRDLFAKLRSDWGLV